MEESHAMDTTVEHRSRRNSNKTARGHRSISNRRRLQFDTLEDRRLLAVAAFNPLAPDGGSIALHFDDTQEIATSNEEDEFTFTVEGGQTLSVIVDGLDPMDNLQPRIELERIKSSSSKLHLLRSPVNTTSSSRARIPLPGPTISTWCSTPSSSESIPTKAMNSWSTVLN